MNQLEKGVVSRKQFDDAAESLRKLYTDMFEETHELRKRMWDLGTLLRLTQNTKRLRRANITTRRRGRRRSRTACVCRLYGLSSP